MKTILRRALVLVMTAAMFMTMVPFCFADGSDSKDASFMERFDKRVAAPKDESILDTPKVMYVTSRYGNCIYVFTRANGSSAQLKNMPEGSKITVYAVENGYALGLDEETGKGGWMGVTLLSDSYYDGPNPLDLKDAPVGVVKPQKGRYLDDYETRYVKSTYGICIYLLNTFVKDDQKVIGKVYEQACVTVVSRQNGYACIIEKDNGLIGWVADCFLVEEYN